MNSALLYVLLKGNRYLNLCLKEACTYQFPSSLCHLFATLLAYCEPNNPLELWETHVIPMAEGFLQLNINHNDTQYKEVEHLNHLLDSMGKDINSYHLVNYKIVMLEAEKFMKEINEEMSIDVLEEDINSISKLNNQQNIYDLILHKVFLNEPAIFFINNPGGKGKTFLHRTILSKVSLKS